MLLSFSLCRWYNTEKEQRKGDAKSRMYTSRIMDGGTDTEENDFEHGCSGWFGFL